MCGWPCPCIMAFSFYCYNFGLRKLECFLFCLFWFSLFHYVGFTAVLYLLSVLRRINVFINWLGRYYDCNLNRKSNRTDDCTNVMLTLQPVWYDAKNSKDSVDNANPTFWDLLHCRNVAKFFKSCFVLFLLIFYQLFTLHRLIQMLSRANNRAGQTYPLLKGRTSLQSPSLMRKKFFTFNIDDTELA